jgi:hypothetical protein
MRMNGCDFRSRQRHGPNYAERTLSVDHPRKANFAQLQDVFDPSGACGRHTNSATIYG